jgi:hypothetical protein
MHILASSARIRVDPVTGRHEFDDLEPPGVASVLPTHDDD